MDLKRSTDVLSNKLKFNFLFRRQNFQMMVRRPHKWTFVFVEINMTRIS
jgi:hypothetical protein